MPAPRRTAREREQAAAGARSLRTRRPPAPRGEALAMLARRGLRPRITRPPLPFLATLDEHAIERFVGLLDHYAFRLFLRGAIQHPQGCAPEEATSYVSPVRARAFGDSLVTLGLAVHDPPPRVRLVHSPASFGGTLEWYIGHALTHWLGFDVVTGVKFHGKPDLLANVGRAVAEGLKAIAP